MIGDLFLKYFNSHIPEYAYDEDGDSVNCEWCGQPIVIHNGEYYCPECDRVYTRQEFFDYIGAEPPGPECLTCDNDYPSCSYCHYGYKDDDEDDDYEEYYGDDDEDDD